MDTAMIPHPEGWATSNFAYKTDFVQEVIHVFMIAISYLCTGLDRPLGLQEVEAPRISRQSAQEGNNVVSPRHRPLLTGTHFC
jgi:hypothetical protein